MTDLARWSSASGVNKFITPLQRYILSPNKRTVYRFFLIWYDKFFHVSVLLIVNAPIIVCQCAYITTLDKLTVRCQKRVRKAKKRRSRCTETSLLKRVSQTREYFHMIVCADFPFFLLSGSWINLQPSLDCSQEYYYVPQYARLSRALQRYKNSPRSRRLRGQSFTSFR